MFKLSNLKYVACALVTIFVISLAMDKPPQGGGWWQSAKNAASQVAGKIGLIETDPKKALITLLDEYKQRPNQKTINEILSLMKQHPELTQQELRDNQTLWLYLALADENSFEPLIRQLFNSNIPLNIDFQSNRQERALITASGYRNFKLVQQLLDHGANVNLQESDGTTALMTTVGRLAFRPDDENLLNILRLLLSVGANPHIRNNLGESAFDLATRFKIAQALAIFNEYKKKTLE